MSIIRDADARRAHLRRLARVPACPAVGGIGVPGPARIERAHLLLWPRVRAALLAVSGRVAHVAGWTAAGRVAKGSVRSDVETSGQHGGNRTPETTRRGHRSQRAYKTCTNRGQPSPGIGFGAAAASSAGRFRTSPRVQSRVLRGPHPRPRRCRPRARRCSPPRPRRTRMVPGRSARADSCPAHT